MTARVFLVEDHPMFRAGLRASLDAAGTLDVVGEAGTATEAAGALRRLRPGADVVLMDLGLPGPSGAEAIQTITAQMPAGEDAPRVLVLTVTEDDDAVVGALRAGAHGYLLKGASRDELLRAISVVADGGAVFAPAIAARLSAYFTDLHGMPARAAFPGLTDRERQILDLLARGHDNRRIARELVLAEKTVRNHVSNVFTKLHVTNRAAAAVRARDAGLGT